jgi:hypothetical protein
VFEITDQNFKISWNRYSDKVAIDDIKYLTNRITGRPINIDLEERVIEYYSMLNAFSQIATIEAPTLIKAVAILQHIDKYGN